LFNLEAHTATRVLRSMPSLASKRDTLVLHSLLGEKHPGRDLAVGRPLAKGIPVTFLIRQSGQWILALRVAAELCHEGRGISLRRAMRNGAHRHKFTGSFRSSDGPKGLSNRDSPESDGSSG
jgi:hypothetical protein